MAKYKRRRKKFHALAENKTKYGNEKRLIRASLSSGQNEKTIETEHGPTYTHCAYDEHYVDPKILAAAEATERALDYAHAVRVGKMKSISLNRPVKYTTSTSPNVLNRFIK
jgi:hypothetical protein|tara:strand:+ start:12487 stop:12819 length:333 start_codon:yes stop_codon:yes gene_type:complete